jgi:hypothetical protein
LTILNGRTLGDYLGQITCHKYNGCSVVDYTMVNSAILDIVKSFHVDFLTPFSDHCQISTRIACSSNLTLPHLHSTELAEVEVTPLPILKSKWESDHIVPFQVALTENQEKMNDFISRDYANIDNMVDDLTNLLGSSALKCSVLKMKKIRPKCRVNKNRASVKNKSKPWYNQSLRDIRKRLFDFCKLLSQHPFDPFLRGVFQLKKLYKRQCRSAKAIFSRKVVDDLSKLDEKNSKSFWEYLKKVKNNFKGQSIPPESSISADRWLTHFKEILSTPLELNKFQQKISDDLENLEKINYGTGPLDNEISVEEISHEVKQLKNGKVSDPDNIINEMLKYGESQLLPSLHKLFNTVLNSGNFPSSWATDHMSLIHKKGTKQDTNNYRGISLSSCLGKLFTRIINTRLSKFLEVNSIIPNEQGRFRKNFRTTDSMFILKSLHDKYRYVKKTGLYTCFVDFSKAFDAVWRPGLLYKLQIVMSLETYIKSFNLCLIKVQCK